MANKGSIYTRKVIAHLLNLSEKRIKQLTQDGVLEEYSNGFYQLVPSVQAYVIYLQRQISDDDTTSDYNTEKAKLTRAKREKEELDLLLRKHEAHLASDIERAISNMLLNFKTKLTTLPHKVLPAIIEAKDKETILKVLSMAICEALEELSEYNPETIVSSDYEDDEDYTDNTEESE